MEMSEVSYRLVEERDFPVITEMFTLLNTYFYQIGYRLPNPENAGELWLDSFPPMISANCSILTTVP
jgi:hypothetical protein